MVITVLVGPLFFFPITNLVHVFKQHNLSRYPNQYNNLTTMSPSNSTTNHGFTSTAVPVADHPPSTATKTSSHTSSSEHKSSSSSSSSSSSEIAAQIPPSSSMGEAIVSGNSKESSLKVIEEGQQSEQQSQKASDVPVVQQHQQQQQQQHQQKQQQYTANPHYNGEATAVGSAQVQQRPPSSASTSASSVASFHTGTSSTAPGHHPYPNHHHQQYQQYPNNHHVQQQHHGPPAASASAGGVYKMSSHNEQQMGGGGVPRGQGHQGHHYPPQHGGGHHNIGSHAPHSNHYPHHNQPSGLVRPTGRYPVSHHGQQVQQQGHGGGHHGRPVTSRISKQYQQQGQYPSHHYHQQQHHQYQAYHQAPGTGGGVATAISTRGMRNSISPVPPGGSLPNTSNANNSGITTTTHDNPNYPSSSGGPYQPKPQVPSQHAQHQQSHYPYDHQQQQQQVQGPPPSQDQRSEHHLSTMHHQGYHQHDMHYNSYHYPAHGAPPVHGGHPSGGVHNNHYRGNHNGGEYGSVLFGYPIGPGGHREVRGPPHHQQQQQSSHGNPSQPVHGFQLPKFNASSNRGSDPTSAVESRIPSESPPPGPPSPPPAPSAQALLRQKLREQETKKVKEQHQQKGENNHHGKIERERSVPLGSVNNNNNNTSGVDSSVRKSIGNLTLNDPNKPSALGDRGNVVKTGISSSTTPTSTDSGVSKPETIPEDPSMDAASILLALGGGPPPRGESRNSCINPPIPRDVVQRSTSPDVSDAGTMLTMQTDAPDLTSDPSSDSIDMETNTGMTQVVSKVPETEFPCRVPDRYPTRLSLPHDASKLNTLHCFLRSELLEIFCITKSNKKSPCHSPSSSVGRVGLRCVHCAMVRGSKRDDREDAPMAVFYPKSIAEIYRLVTSWQRCHLRKCRNVPPAARSRWQTLRDNDKSRGKTHYWVTSAKQIGLMDCQSRAGGIRFAPDFDPMTLPAETMLTSSAEKSAAIAAKAQKIVSMAAAAEAEAASIQNGVSMDSSSTINTDSVPAVDQIISI